jgi:beta-lactamase superfamily II metal-dependent hydrolase
MRGFTLRLNYFEGVSRKRHVLYIGTLTVLKVTHYGSNTSSTPFFLNSFKPEIAVIQVGADNSYGHPTPRRSNASTRRAPKSSAMTSMGT